MKRVLKVLVVLTAMATAVLAILLFVFGMKVETRGGGVPAIAFHNEARQWRTLEAHRAASQAEANNVVTDSASSETAWGGWPRYRGPGMDGLWAGSASLDWPDGPPVLFQQPIGAGYASFVGGEGMVFTIEQRRELEVVAAYDPRTGAERWTHSWPARFEETMGGDGPRATPAYSNGKLVAIGALGDLVVLDARDGAKLWGINILEHAAAGNISWGVSASPLIVDGLVVTQPGGEGASVVAYDLDTGRERWRALSDRASYTAPMIANLMGVRQLLLVTAQRAVGLAIDDGELLWEFPWQTDNDVNAAQPILLSEDRVFLSAGYGHGAVVFRVDFRGNSYQAEELWHSTSMKNQFSSSVLWGDSIYGLDNGILACIDVETGERRWKGGRYGHGQLLLAGGALIVLTEKGNLAVVELTPEEHRERSQHRLLSGKTWNVPAVVDGVLLVRNAREMAAIDLEATS